MAEICDSSIGDNNDIDIGINSDLRELVFCDVWESISSSPKSKKRYLSRLQRIILGAEKEYMMIILGNSSTKGGTSKAPSFEGISKDFPPSSNLPEGLLLAQSIYCAKTALAFYNDKHATDYTLIEPLASGRILNRGRGRDVSFHCNFTALKLTDDGSAQPELFFAYILPHDKKCRNLHCCIIDSAEATVMCCKDCPPDLTHCDHLYSSYSLANIYPPKVLTAKKHQVCAKTALDVYNQRHGTNYNLVKSLESNIVPLNFGAYQFHCNFKAKLEGPDDASIKLFFGDIIKFSHIFIGDCRILDSTDNLDDHCPICQEGIFHPPPAPGNTRNIVLGNQIMIKNCSDIDNNLMELAFSYLCEALVDTPKGEQSLLSRLVSISLEAKEDFLRIKDERNPEIGSCLDHKIQDCDVTEASPKDSTAKAAFASSTSQKFKVSSDLCQLRKVIMSKFSNCSNKNNDINVVKPVLTYIFEELENTTQGRTWRKVRLVSLLHSLAMKAHDCDICPTPATHVPFVSCTGRKSKASRQLLLRKKIVAENIESSNIDAETPVLLYGWHLFTPLGQERFLSRLQRISLKAKKEYLNIRTSFPRTEGLSEDKAQYSDMSTKASSSTHAAAGSSTCSKSKALFENVCEKLSPAYKLPEGLILARSIYCAKAGLAFYNEKHGTNYKLVEPLSSAQYLVSGSQFHSNFTASEFKNGSRSAQVKLFYADFRCSKRKVREMHCCIIDSAKATFCCCEYCPPDLAHCYQRSINFSLFVPFNYRVSSTQLEDRKNLICAKTILDSYNEKHGTKYELVKSLESNIIPISFGVYVFHCNFKAKLENLGKNSPMLFFGEYMKSTPNTYAECYILDSTEGLNDQCKICQRGGVFHPVHFRSLCCNLYG